MVVVVGGLSYFDRSAESFLLSGRTVARLTVGVRVDDERGSEACSLSLAICGMKLFRRGGTRS